MYPAEWHRLYGDKTGESARRILPGLIARFGATSLVEVGCGNGHWTQAAIEAGVEDWRVVDGPWNNRDHLLVDKARFTEADLSRPLNLGRRFDMALCLEVAEHVQEASADVLVTSLTAASDLVVFGAAIPFQGGHGHINEQWPSWWRDRFTAQGYRAFDLVRPLHWHDAAIHYWYRQNMFVYVRESRADLLDKAGPASDIALFDAVHPEKFLEVASYESLVLKRLLKRLPGWLAMRLRSKLAGLG
jgi:SAM-dependent methyltransferase